jgi:hypothetical protein
MFFCDPVLDAVALQEKVARKRRRVGVEPQKGLRRRIWRASRTARLCARLGLKKNAPDWTWERLTSDDLGCRLYLYVPQYDQRSRGTASVNEDSQC